ncbi:hypothetical protein [Providencia huashanensis]|uniref:hypothetical protein n=1 Tax=Providencia huashanensis TaxID=3037798 RepID=UPI002AFE99E3|nr:hypothetical protein [Providencia sp. 23021821]
MPIDSSDFAASARRLVNSEFEVDYRNTISRAYYATYHLFLESLMHCPSFACNHHQNLIGYMSNQNECKLEPYDKVKLKVLAYKLSQLRAERNEADYDLSSDSIVKKNAELAIETMDSFIEDWNNLKR